MGLSEHFELLFKVPPSSAPAAGRKCPDGMSQANCVDYLYSPSLDISGVANGMWGLFRSYDPTTTATKLQPLPSNPIGPAAPVSFATCPGPVNRVFNITAVTSQKALANQNPFPGTIVFNGRGNPLEVLTNAEGVMYVRTEDLNNGVLKPGVPVEPLILRANAGDCIEVNLTNGIDPSSNIFKQDFFLAPPFNGVNPANNQPVYQSKMSSYAGLHPQLLSYDAAKSYGFNVGWNAEGQTQQAVGFGKTIKYQWYAGKIDRAANGTLTYTPVEFGALNLFPSDPVYQHLNGMFGSMIIEPAGAQWKPPNGGCGEPGNLADCDPGAGNPPTTRASATINLQDRTFFREFAVMISDNIRMTPNPDGTANSSAVNYRTEPWKFRYAHNAIQDFSCMLSNELVGGQDPQTPIFAAGVGDKVRFRMTHPFGTGTSQVFSLHGHVWQRNPYASNSTQLGNQPLSQWIGSRDNHGSTDHFDLVIDKAGGEGGRAGDYLYTVFQFLQARVGAWGVFRVGNVPPGAPSNNPACKVITPPPAYVAPAATDDLNRFVRPALNSEKKQ
jgi:hypothetical protein